MRKTATIWVLAAVMVLSAAPFVSCGKQAQEQISLKLNQTTSDASGSTQFVFVTADCDWSLILTDAAGQTPEWAWLSDFDSDEQLPIIIGNGDNSRIVLHWLSNTTSAERSLTLTLRGLSSEQTASLKQSGSTQPVVDPIDIKECVPGSFMELPKFEKRENFYFISHDATISGKLVRNYAFCWDTDNLVARWVAYPLNKWYIGSGSRTDEWGLDPNVPKSAQPVLYRAFQGFGARGHQLPSADRLTREANIQTFYGTNMTPQDYNFNSGMWANLEGAVRNWSYIFDTLYVVTGCTVEGSTRKAYDNMGKAVTVPSGYYKVLLGYGGASSTGQTRFSRFKDTGYYTGIAFYFNNEDYSGHDYMSCKMTIDEIEAMTGFDFFTNLSPAYASKVESTVDSGWAGNFK